MKLYQQYVKILDRIKPLEVAWFTTFNVDVEMVERFLFCCMADKVPQEIKTSEDYEALNLELQNIDIKVWYDYRAMNAEGSKRTTSDFIPVDPRTFTDSSSADIVFHPKVIFLKGQGGAYLLCGSVNLTIAAWGSNKEAILIKEITSRKNADEILSFFERLYSEEENALGRQNAFSKLRQWQKTLSGDPTNWTFFHSLGGTGSLFDVLDKGNLTVWSPYFSRDTSGLTSRLLKSGFRKVTLVPGISPTGKVRITPEEIEKLMATDGVNIQRSKDEGLIQAQVFRTSHAKVWLTDAQLAVGSWNCSFRATGLQTAVTERNTEAGIIVPVTKSIGQQLLSTLAPVDVATMSGTSETELDSEWDQALNPYTMDCKIVADWKNFTYHLASDLHQGYTVSLPDRPLELFALAEVNNHSFRENYRRVLKDKSYTVYDFDSKPVYSGFLIETNTSQRQASSYATLDDLFDALLANPLSETSRKVCQYQFPEESNGQEIADAQIMEFHGHGSYYTMFVAFQRLFDVIEQSAQKPQELDKIGFRLSGSLLNIAALVTEAIATAERVSDEDNYLYHYFLASELNRCIARFNALSVQTINPLGVEFLIGRLNPSEQDLGFIKKLKDEFGYVNV